MIPCRSGDTLLRRLFEPLGYRVTATRHPLDEKFPEWGESSYYTVELSAECRLQDLLAHLYVLIPVLDDDKHYWVSRDEVDKLLSKGEGWLESHPEKELITQRYLKYRSGLMRAALERLVEEESPDASEVEEAHAAEEEAVETPLRLYDQRLMAVLDALKNVGSKSVIDLGCGEGKLLKLLLNDKSFERIVGMDVSYRTLEIAQRRLNFDRLPPKQRERVEVIHGSSR